MLTFVVLVLFLASLTGLGAEVLKRPLMRWIEAQPWKGRMIPLQRQTMHNFGFSKACTADEHLVVDSYAFLIMICSHHCVMSIFLAPVVFLGWEGAGSIGQLFFYLGAVGDLAFSVYDSIQIALRTFASKSTSKFLGARLPVKYFVSMVCLHHSLSMLLTLPMIIHYPSMKALHLIMSSLLFAGGTCYLLGCYKFTLDTKNSSDFLQYKAVVVVQLLIIWLTRGYIWISQAYAAMRFFYQQGDVVFFCGAMTGGLLMSLFNLLMLVDATKAALKWLPRPLKQHKTRDVTHLSCDESVPLKQGLHKRLQGLNRAAVAQ